MGQLSLVGSTCGQPTDANYLRLVNNAAAGDMSITVDSVPTSWTAGKKIVISPRSALKMNLKGSMSFFHYHFENLNKWPNRNRV